MEYLKVSWIHDEENDPVLFYSELDQERYEVRKIEIYRNGSFGLASLNFEYNGSVLGMGSIPNIAEIAKEPVFLVHETSNEEFEKVWNEYLKASRK